jgi:hypothetical protein
VHAAERSLTFVDQSGMIEGNQAISTTLDGQPLVAEQFFTDNYSDSYVQVTLSGNEIFRIPTGPASPVPSLRGLWVVGNHWALETILINLAGDNVTTPFAMGQVSLDAVLQNQAKGYQETFGLQTMAGKLFYFFKKDGKIGYSYDGQETMLGYDEILHYNCCSESALNPVQAQDMVAFFARTGDTWYYSELGVFGK